MPLVLDRARANKKKERKKYKSNKKDF